VRVRKEGENAGKHGSRGLERICLFGEKSGDLSSAAGIMRATDGRLKAYILFRWIRKREKQMREADVTHTRQGSLGS
jgi:hypothetical protein